MNQFAKKFFYVYVLYISRTYTLFRTFFWTRNRKKFSYTFYLYVFLYVLRIRSTYTFYVHIYVYVIVRENVYVAFWFCFEFSAQLSLMTSINSCLFLSRKVSCAPNSCEARSQVLLFRIYQKSPFRLVVKRLIFSLFWFQISVVKIYNKNEHMFDYHMQS